MAARRRSNVRAAVLPARRPLPDVRAAIPSGRSILAGLLLFALAVGVYVAARETSLFAVRAVQVRGATPQVRELVREALAPELGRSLLRVDAGELDRRLAGITGVRSFTYDRAFPHTLTVVLRAERPVLVLRQGANAFLVSASGRVLRQMSHPRLSPLPRVYVTHDVQIVVGQQLPASAAAAALALGPLQGAPLPGGVRLVENGSQGLLFVLHGGLQVRLGDNGDLRLKLAIARRILAATGAATAGSGYLDVSVPERPVLSMNSQVGGGG